MYIVNSASSIKKVTIKKSISAFGYEKKVKYLIHVSKKCSKEKHASLLLIGKEGKKALCFNQIF